eukprot:366027-Chlamydomonas_euryale.AAC.2
MQNYVCWLLASEVYQISDASSQQTHEVPRRARSTDRNAIDQPGRLDGLSSVLGVLFSNAADGHGDPPERLGDPGGRSLARNVSEYAALPPLRGDTSTSAAAAARTQHARSKSASWLLDVGAAAAAAPHAAAAASLAVPAGRCGDAAHASVGLSRGGDGGGGGGSGEPSLARTSLPPRFPPMPPTPQPPGRAAETAAARVVQQGDPQREACVPLLSGLAAAAAPPMTPPLRAPPPPCAPSPQLSGHGPVWQADVAPSRSSTPPLPVLYAGVLGSGAGGGGALGGAGGAAALPERFRDAGALRSDVRRLAELQARLADVRAAANAARCELAQVRLRPYGVKSAVMLSVK